MTAEQNRGAYSQADIDVIRQCRKQGWSCDVIAMEIGRSEKSVQVFCRKQGFSLVPAKPLTKEQEQKARVLRMEGHEHREIADMLGKPPNVIRKFFNLPLPRERGKRRAVELPCMDWPRDTWFDDCPRAVLDKGSPGRMLGPVGL